MGKRAAVIEVPDYFTPRDALNKLFDYYGSYSEPGGEKVKVSDHCHSPWYTEWGF